MTAAELRAGRPEPESFREANPTTATALPPRWAKRSSAFWLASKNAGEQQVARRITAQRQLGKHHQFGAGLVGTLPCLYDLFRVPLEIADGGIDLCDGNLHLPLGQDIGERAAAKVRIVRPAKRLVCPLKPLGQFL